jgi:putative membrane protein
MSSLRRNKAEMRSPVSDASATPPRQAAHARVTSPPTREGTDPGDGNAAGPGTGPDPRDTFANERTFLSWSRTALALIAGGLAVSQFVKRSSAGLTLAVALALIGFGALMAVVGYQHWTRNQTALRLGTPVEPSALPRFLTHGIGYFAIAAAALAVIRLVS